VKLTEVPLRGSKFDSWGGACASRKSKTTCTVVMSKARNVVAIFVKK
jgi:List-Bact-rpt repeat protein